MTVFSSLPEDAHLLHVLKRFPKMVKPLLELHDEILRSDSGLSIGERELIAAYVSLQNSCNFCHGAHTAIASTYGIEPELLDSNIDTANIPQKLKPILAYVKKLTLTPSKICESDAKAVYLAGWTEEDLFDAISSCALFNFMNRIVDGSDINVASPRTQNDADNAKLESYVSLAKILELS